MIFFLSQNTLKNPSVINGMSFDIVIMLHIYRAAIYVGVGCKTDLFYLFSVIESQESLPCFVLKVKVAARWRGSFLTIFCISNNLWKISKSTFVFFCFKIEITITDSHYWQPFCLSFGFQNHWISINQFTSVVV